MRRQDHKPSAAWFVLLLALTLLRPVLADENKLPARDKFHLFLLVGQSNMAGRGKVTDDDRKPHARVLMLTKGNTWAPAIDPLHFDKPRIVGVGLGKTFGIELAKARPGVTIGLIPCAVGGSPIASWEPGGYHASTKTHPYDDAMKRARVALKAGTLKGILWHQGESDASPEKSAVYEAKLHALIARLRKELNGHDVPFIAGQMGQFPTRPWSDGKRKVDRAHRDLPKKVKRTAFVNSNDLTHKGDHVHFDAASYRELGRRYAKAFLALVKEANENK